MLAVERTHRLADDRAWLPRHVRRSAQLTAGSLMVGAGAAAVGAVIAAPAALLLWKGLLFAGAGVAVASERAGKAVLRRQIRRMARGELDLAELRNREEGELVVVRGTIESDAPLRGVLVDTDGVFRRLEFRGKGDWVHEAAVDFFLVDESGERIFVQAAGARWLAPTRERVVYPQERLSSERVPAAVRELAAGRESFEAIEQVLAVGSRIQIVGYKTTKPDVGGDVRDYRSPPERATLRSGAQLPLVITRAADLEG